MIRAGAQRGAARLGVPLSACRLVIVGDTPKDVAAAHANGCECVAVATGGASFDDLVAADGDLVCHDLTDPAAMVTLIGMSATSDALAATGGDV